MCTGKKKKKMMNKQEQEKICVTRVHTIGDCELRSLLIVAVSSSINNRYWFNAKISIDSDRHLWALGIDQGSPDTRNKLNKNWKAVILK